MDMEFDSIQEAYYFFARDLLPASKNDAGQPKPKNYEAVRAMLDGKRVLRVYVCVCSRLCVRVCVCVSRWVCLQGRHGQTQA